MKKKIDLLLEQALTPIELPQQRLNDQILQKVKEREDMKKEQIHHRKRIPAAAVIVACILILCSSTALAVYKYLSPAEVAMETDDSALHKAFLSEDAIVVDETQEYGGYKATLLGSVAGTDISDFLGEGEQGEVRDNRIYTVVAIERADGTPMPDTSSDEYGKEDFYVSHYIRGLDPSAYSVMTMGGSYTAIVRNGIEYRILDMENIEMFADKGIYVGVNSGTFYDMGAYVYDAGTGEMRRNEDYAGMNALFELPVDVSKADPAAAEAYLEALEAAMSAPDEPVEKDGTDLSVEAFIEKVTPENIDSYADPIESTRQICQTSTIEGKECVRYSYDTGNGGGSGEIPIDWLFPDGKAGKSASLRYGYTEDGLDSLQIEVFILNEDGTVTFVAYQPRTS